MNRRKFIKSSIYSAIGIGCLSSLYAWQIEPFWLEFVHKNMPINNLPSSLIGKNLMQISDVHVGNRFDYQYIIDSFTKAQQYQPDFVVYTGDFVSYEDVTQFKQLEKVLQYAPKGKIASVGILGNHDYGNNWAEQEVANHIVIQLENNGIQVLRNQQRTYEGLNIIGFDDFWSKNFAPQKVMSQYNPSNANLVLCHNPDVCDLDIWNDYQGWILSGHTHGGQCKPPFLKPPVLPVQNNRYTQGQIDLHDGRTLYINRALGHLWQVRFNVRPEITIFNLQKAS